MDWNRGSKSWFFKHAHTMQLLVYSSSICTTLFNYLGESGITVVNLVFDVDIEKQIYFLEVLTLHIDGVAAAPKLLTCLGENCFLVILIGVFLCVLGFGENIIGHSCCKISSRT